MNFLRLKLTLTGPYKNLERGLDFFLIVIPELWFIEVRDPSICVLHFLLLTINKRLISPLMLNLYLNPLYSIRGDSTTLAEPFTKYD